MCSSSMTLPRAEGKIRMNSQSCFSTTRWVTYPNSEHKKKKKSHHFWGLFSPISKSKLNIQNLVDFAMMNKREPDRSKFRNDWCTPSKIWNLSFQIYFWKLKRPSGGVGVLKSGCLSIQGDSVELSPMWGCGDTGDAGRVGLWWWQ